MPRGEAAHSEIRPASRFARLDCLAELYRAVGLILIAILALAAAAVQWERTGEHPGLTEFLLVLSLCFGGMFFPLTGPRGQRIWLLPGMGLIAVFLLPPYAASVAALLAVTTTAAFLKPRFARNAALCRGAWVACGVVVSGFLSAALGADGPAYGAYALVTTTTLYISICLFGQQVLAYGPGARRHASGDPAVEPIVLLVSTPFALLAVAAYRHSGDAGLITAILVFVPFYVAFGFGASIVALRNQVRAMEKIGAVTLAQTNPLRVAERFLHLSSTVICCDRAVIWLAGDCGMWLERMESPLLGSHLVRSAGDAIPFGAGIIGKAAVEKSVRIVRDGAREAELYHGEASGSKAAFSCLLIPLVADETTIAVAQFDCVGGQVYRSRDADQLAPLASQAAAAMRNVRLHQAVYSQSITDDLTGLFNHRHIYNVLLDEHRRAQRYDRPFSIVLVDIDGFKKYNDTHGLPRGDALLRAMALLVQDTVRTVDIVGRFGGEEFVILMPETGKADAWLAAERLRLAVASTTFPGQPGNPEAHVSMTVSLGIATFPDDAVNVETMVLEADQALFLAKRQGRNRIESVKSPAGARRHQHP